jgi:hypothetical protein
MANDRTGFTGTWEILDSSLKKTGPGATGTANSRMIRLATRLRPNGDEMQTLHGIAKRRKRSAAK